MENESDSQTGDIDDAPVNDRPWINRLWGATAIAVGALFMRTPDDGPVWLDVTSKVVGSLFIAEGGVDLYTAKHHLLSSAVVTKLASLLRQKNT